MGARALNLQTSDLSTTAQSIVNDRQDVRSAKCTFAERCTLALIRAGFMNSPQAHLSTSSHACAYACMIDQSLVNIIRTYVITQSQSLITKFTGTHSKARLPALITKPCTQRLTILKKILKFATSRIPQSVHMWTFSKSFQNLSKLDQIERFGVPGLLPLQSLQPLDFSISLTHFMCDMKPKATSSRARGLGTRVYGH